MRHRHSIYVATLVALAMLAADASDGKAFAQSENDPLETRLVRSGLTESELSRTSSNEGGVIDAELRLVSIPAGLGLRSTRQLETGGGVERRQCRAPCTTYLEQGSYTFAVETRRGRRRPVAGTYSVFFDGTLELAIRSRRLVRAAWWSTTISLVGSGLALYLTHRERQFRDDPFCVSNCTYYTTGQRVAMSTGGVMVMFGGITMRYAISTRDSGVVHYHPSRRARHIDPDE